MSVRGDAFGAFVVCGLRECVCVIASPARSTRCMKCGEAVAALGSSPVLRTELIGCGWWLCACSVRVWTHKKEKKKKKKKTKEKSGPLDKKREREDSPGARVRVRVLTML